MQRPIMNPQQLGDQVYDIHARIDNFTEFNMRQEGRIRDKMEESLRVLKAEQAEMNTKLEQMIYSHKGFTLDICGKNAKHIKAQKAEIVELKTEVAGLKEVVKQLIGGLYNQQTQRNVLDRELSSIGIESSDCTHCGKKFNCDVCCIDKSKWGIWPTTRQGDECEKRLDDCERRLDAMIHVIKDIGTLLVSKTTNIDEYDDDESVSDTTADSSNSSDSRRVRNSSYLCGNE